MTRRSSFAKADLAPAKAPPATAPEAPEKKERAPVGASGRVSMSVYLSTDAYDQMMQLCLVKRTKASALLRDGLNKIFQENGLPPIA